VGTTSSPRDRSPWTSERPLPGTDRYGYDVVHTVTSATADRGTYSELATGNQPTSLMSARADDVSLTDTSVCTGIYIAADDVMYGLRSRSETAGRAVLTHATPGVLSRPSMPPIPERLPSASAHHGISHAAASVPLVPPPSMVSDRPDTIVSAYASDTDDECSVFGLNTSRPRSRHSVAWSHISQTSHHSEALQLARRRSPMH